eukprot:200775-Chlamydomonas_euryale.AAC.9
MAVEDRKTQLVVLTEPPYQHSQQHFKLNLAFKLAWLGRCSASRRPLVESFGPSQNGHAASIKSGGRTTSVQVVPGVGSPDARGLCPLQMPTRVHLHVTHDTHQHMILGMIAHEPLHHALAHHKRWANFDINATYGYIAFHHLQLHTTHKTGEAGIKCQHDKKVTGDAHACKSPLSNQGKTERSSHSWHTVVCACIGRAVPFASQNARM